MLPYLPYTPFTSEDLSAAGSVVSDLSSYADVSQHFPSGKQVIFFTIGMVAIIGAIGLTARILIGDEIDPKLLAKLAPLAA